MSDCRFGVSPVNYPDPDRLNCFPLSVINGVILSPFPTCAVDGANQLLLFIL